MSVGVVASRCRHAPQAARGTRTAFVVPRSIVAASLAAGALGASIAVAAAAAPVTQTCDTRTSPLSAPADRFEARDDGTIVDKASRLMWMRCSAGQTWSAGRCDGDARLFDYPAALSAADEVNRRGTLFFGDWRVPRALELATIAERQCANPRINLAIFPGTPADFYWTTTTRPNSPDGFAYGLSFGDEGIRYLSKDQGVHLRLVRDAR